MNEQKSIFITGGTSGIGLALAKYYLNTGARVGVSGRDLSKVPSELSEQGLLSYKMDITKKEEVLAGIREFSREGLDLVVANAGVSVGTKTVRPDFIKSKQVIKTNLLGVLYTMEAVYDHFVKNGGGHFAAIASVAGYVGLPGASSYSASKAAVIKLCESYSLDMRAQNIGITCICPGFIKTPLTDKNNHSMPFLMSVEEGARRIAKAIEKKKGLYTFPLPMYLLINTLAMLPRGLYRMLMGIKMFNYSAKEEK